MSDRMKRDPKTRNATKAAEGVTDKWKRLVEKSSSDKVTWWDAEPQLLHQVVANVTEDGAALLLSVTSDGGALALHIISDAGTNKLYPASGTELNQYLERIMELSKLAD
jgi:hypothetical protein